MAKNKDEKLLKAFGENLIKPAIVKRQEGVEVDELRTFVGCKRNEYWVAYALNWQTGDIVKLNRIT